MWLTHEVQPTMWPTHEVQPTMWPTHEVQPTMWPTHEVQPTMWPIHGEQVAYSGCATYESRVEKGRKRAFNNENITHFFQLWSY